MAHLIVGQRPQPMPIAEVALGPFRLTRVALTDPALAHELDPRWSLSELLVLHADGEVAPWQARVAREFASELGDELGSVREVSLRGAPTAQAAPATTATTTEAPALDAEAIAAWLSDGCDADGFVPPEHRPPQLPENATDVCVTAAALDPSEIVALVAAVRDARDAALPEAYLELLLEVGALRVEWLDADGEPCGDAGFLTPAEVRADLADFDDADAVIPFYRVDEHTVFAFDPAAGGAIVYRDDGDVLEWFAQSFPQWLAAWRATLGVELDEALHPIAPPPPDAAALARRWRTIEAWVRPMYESYQPT